MSNMRSKLIEESERADFLINKIREFSDRDITVENVVSERAFILEELNKMRANLNIKIE